MNQPIPPATITRGTVAAGAVLTARVVGSVGTDVADGAGLIATPAP